jgi:plastocyanin
MGAPAVAADCGMQAAAQPFIEHLNGAHLERSPAQQVQDLVNVDSYVLAHTALAGAMLSPALSGTMSAIDPFVEHVGSAHLERSPLEQARDLVATDDYVLAHTVLVESMLAPTLTGCPPASGGHSHGGTPPPAASEPAPAATVAVAMKDYAFAPKDISVPAGTTVVWTNADDDDHNVKGAGLSSATFGKGGTYSHTFGSPGSFAYVCSLHPQMKGTVTVL